MMKAIERQSLIKRKLLNTANEKGEDAELLPYILNERMKQNGTTKKSFL